MNGVELAYREMGKGEPVVFVHGGINDLRVWQHQMEAFGARHRTVAPSCRHFHPNAGPAAGDELPLPTLAEDLAALLRRLDLAPAHLVGSSSGAFVCLLLASGRPELVRSLVLAEPPVLSILGVGVPPSPLQILALLLRDPTSALAVVRFAALGIGPAARAYERGQHELGARRFTRAVLGRDDAAALSESMRRQIEDNARTFGAQLRAGLPAFGTEDARAIGVPTLLVSGRRSAPVHLRIVDRLERLIPRAERLDLADASHLMFHDRPAAFNRHVLAFLSEHGGSGDGGRPADRRGPRPEEEEDGFRKAPR